MAPPAPRRGARLPPRRHAVRPPTPPRPAFRLERVEEDHVVVLRVHGELDLATGARLKRALQRERAAANKVVIDLCPCEFLDSSGLAFLLGAVRREPDDVAIACLPEGLVRRAFRVTRFYELATVHPSAEDAAAALV